MPTQTIGAGHARELQEIADSICRSSQVLMVTGAGISTNSGIPDFRSADGLYNLVKRRYPDQTALLKGRDLFDAISFTNPITTSILYSFLAELRQTVKTIKDTTPTHKFIKNLAETGRLLRCYTQNIDGLEALDGLCMDISRGAGKKGKGKERVGREAGCEVVQLHGDLEMLRCTQCAKLHDYDQERWETLLGGEAPECPDCSRKADDRMAAGKRSITVGSLRPNIVLYDELHPQGEAIGQLTHYDATRSTPDMLLIFGTSLKVIGLKRIVKAFAGKVKSKGGKVVYINATPAADSVWGDIIDYHIQMDCDAWIKDLRLRRKEIWLHQSQLDKEWRKSKPGIPSLRKSKTTTGYGSDKENGSDLISESSLIRRKSLSALSGKKKNTTQPLRSKQLPTPTNTPRKLKTLKAVSLPNTPSTGSKRHHKAAFGPDSLASSPSSSAAGTPNKRSRLSSVPLPPMNASTPRHWNRIQDLRTPQRPSPGSYSWLPSSRESSLRTGYSTPTRAAARYAGMDTPDRLIPDSPLLLSETNTEYHEATPRKRRLILDHIAVPPATAELRAQFLPMTPKRPTRSEISSVHTSARRSAQKHGVNVQDMVIERSPSPTPTTKYRGRGGRQAFEDMSNSHQEDDEEDDDDDDDDIVELVPGGSVVSLGQLPTPPASQETLDSRPSTPNTGRHGGGSDIKYLPRPKGSPRRRFVPDSFHDDLRSDDTEASEQLEKELEMSLTSIPKSVPAKTTSSSSTATSETDDSETSLLSESTEVTSATDDTPISLPSNKATVPAFSTPDVQRIVDSTSSSTGKRRQSPHTVTPIERRRTRWLEKEEEIQKVLAKPGTVTRREAERRKSMRDLKVYV